MAGTFVYRGGQGLWCGWCECELTVDTPYCGERCEQRAEAFRRSQYHTPSFWVVNCTRVPFLGMVAGRKRHPSLAVPVGEYGWVTTADCVITFQAEQDAAEWARRVVKRDYQIVHVSE